MYVGFAFPAFRFLGIPVSFCSRIPGKGTASFLAKTGMVQLTALLSFSVLAACFRDASSELVDESLLDMMQMADTAAAATEHWSVTSATCSHAQWCPVWLTLMSPLAGEHADSLARLPSACCCWPAAPYRRRACIVTQTRIISITVSKSLVSNDGGLY